MRNIILSLYFLFENILILKTKLLFLRDREGGKEREKSYEDKLFYLIYGSVNGHFCRQQKVVFLKKIIKQTAPLKKA